MSIQVIQDDRENVLGKSLLGAIQGFTSGREMKRKQQEQTLANMKAMAELGKIQQEAENERMAREMIMGAYRPQSQQQAPQRVPMGGSQPNIQVPLDPGGGVHYVQPDPNYQQPQHQMTLPRRPIAKSFKFGGQEFINPDYAQYESELETQKEARKSEMQAQTAKRKKELEWDVKRSDVRRRLGNIYKLSDRVPRGKGVIPGLMLPGRLLSGAKSKVEAWYQNSPRGLAASQLEDSANDILAPLARLAGDVGNLAEWEQKIRKNLVPSIWDSQERTELKKAYLNELAKLANDPNITGNEIDAFFNRIGANSNARGSELKNMSEQELLAKLARVEADNGNS